MTPDEGLAPARVELAVRDLAGTAAFYRTVLGLRTFAEGTSEVLLGVDRPILRLIERAKGDRRREAGLFHFAVLYPSRHDLGAAVRGVLRAGTLDGAADHGVSEAVYLSDPEGNGIELYRDRPRSDWPFEDGRLAMFTRPLDVRGLVDRVLEAPSSARLGHVHLAVGDVGLEERFYREVIGFDVMQRMPSATFLAFAGYHHHLGLNQWQTAGVPARRPGGLGLERVVFEASAEGRQEVFARVQRVSVAWTAVPSGFSVVDPAGCTAWVVDRETSEERRDV